MFYVSTPAVFNQSFAAAVLIFLKDFASMKFQHYIFTHFEINIILIRIPNVFFLFLFIFYTTSQLGLETECKLPANELQAALFCLTVHCCLQEKVRSRFPFLFLWDLWLWFKIVHHLLPESTVIMELRLIYYKYRKLVQVSRLLQ